MTKISPASGTSVMAPAIGSVGAMPSTIIAQILRCGASNGERVGVAGEELGDALAAGGDDGQIVVGGAGDDLLDAAAADHDVAAAGRVVLLQLREVDAEVDVAGGLAQVPGERDRRAGDRDLDVAVVDRVLDPVGDAEGALAVDRAGRSARPCS